MSSSFQMSEMGRTVKNYINEMFKEREAWEIIGITCVTFYCTVFVTKLIFNLCEEGLTQVMWYYLRKLPFVKHEVEKRLKATADTIDKELHKGLENKKFIKQLPNSSMESNEILKKVDEYLSFGKYSWKEGYVSGAVYSGNNEELYDLMKNVFGKTGYTNPLHPDVFPGIRMMEAQIIRMVATLFNAKEAIGAVTNGGTESIFLVCKAYRDYARHEKGIKDPNMVIPITAHAAFEKAAHLLKIKVKLIRLDPTSMKVNVNAMKNAINKNTCMLVGSAPNFPYGCIDNIEKIAMVGSKYNIPVHVDSCLGGFLLPFMKQAGFPLPPFDFSVNGVTSISVDTHKYAYAPKGTSVILYSDKKYKHHQYSVQPNWPGGIYGTPNLSGSRSGGLIATCWASLLYHGHNHYVECTKKIISVTKYVEKGLRDIDGIHIIGKPEVSVIALGSHAFDIYRLSSALTEVGWNLNVLQFPSGFHMCFTLQHTYEGVADKFLSDVRECTAEILKDPGSKATGTAAIYGMAQQIPDRSLVSEIVWAYLDSVSSIKDDTPAEKE